MKGTVSACREFNQEPPGKGKISPRIIRKLGIMVIDSGIIIVLSSKANNASRPKNLIRAKAYPAKIEVVSRPAIVVKVTITLFKK